MDDETRSVLADLQARMAVTEMLVAHALERTFGTEGELAAWTERQADGVARRMEFEGAGVIEPGSRAGVYQAAWDDALGRLRAVFRQRRL